MARENLQGHTLFLGSAVAREPALSPIFSVEFTIPAVVTVERLAVVTIERLAVVTVERLAVVTIERLAVVTVERLAVVAVERLAVVARTVVVKWAFSSPIFAVGITAIVARTLAR